MKSTNYTSTLIDVADDCPVRVARVPDVPMAGKVASMARLQYELLSQRPYHYTSDALLIEVHAMRFGVTHEEAQKQFFGKPQACLRASPLPKTHGFALPHDESSRVALVPRESVAYEVFKQSAGTTCVKAMRSRRA